MAIRHIYTITLGAYLKRRVLDTTIGKPPQQFSCFRFYLLFFTPNVRENIICNIKRRYTRVTRSGNRLHGRNDYGFNSERRLQWRQRNHHTDRRTIRIRNDKASVVT